MNGWLGIRYGKQCKNIYTEDGVQRSLKVTLWRQSRNNVGMTNEIDINVFYKT